MQDPAKNEATTLLLLHGHGDRPEDLTMVGTELAEATGLALWAPAAPHRAGRGHAWWPDGEETPDAALVRRLADGSEAHGAPACVVGFSQGAATALSVGRVLGDTRPDTPLRIVVVAGFLPGDGAVPSGAEVLVVVGRRDEVVDPFHGELVARRCRRAGCDVTEVEHDGGHVWDDRVSELVRSWLRS